MLNDLKLKSPEAIRRGLITLAGLVLFLSPWLFGFAGEPAAAWSAWLLGAIIAGAGVVSIVQPQTWERWVNLALGLVALAAPWLLGFAAVGSALTIHMIAGVVTALLAAFDLWRSNKRPLSAA